MKVAVIGAGISGLITIKCCLDEGLDVVCFEKDGDLGGLWRFEEGDRNGGTVYETTVMNSCKELIAFTDFPPPAYLPNFMHHTKLMEYFRLFADNFNLTKHIRFNTEVKKCEHANDFDQTGKWKITYTKDGDENAEVYDGVLVCIGHHGEPNLPLKDFPGIEKYFSNDYIHSNWYRNMSAYKNQNVAVIGTGNSGCDLAVEISRTAKQVYLSTRRGVWIFNRMMDYGIPFDISLITRFNMLMKLKCTTLMNFVFERYLNSRFNHEKYGLKANHRVLSQHPTINDEMPNRILNGTVKVKTNIVRFEERSAVFADGSKEPIDKVIFATGYNYSFPFLDEKIIKVVQNENELYMLMWPMNSTKNTLGVIGLQQPFHSINNVSEMQARWAARVLSGKCKLPSNSEMRGSYRKMKETMKKSFIASKRHTIEVDGIDYMDQIATMIGCKPNYFGMILKDPVLAYKIYFGPCTGYQYRLRGPGSWKGARNAIMTQHERIEAATKTRSCSGDSNGQNWSYLAVIVALISLAYLLIFKYSPSCVLS